MLLSRIEHAEEKYSKPKRATTQQRQIAAGINLVSYQILQQTKAPPITQRLLQASIEQCTGTAAAAVEEAVRDTITLLVLGSGILWKLGLPRFESRACRKREERGTDCRIPRNYLRISAQRIAVLRSTRREDLTSTGERRGETERACTRRAKTPSYECKKGECSLVFGAACYGLAEGDGRFSRARCMYPSTGAATITTSHPDIHPCEAVVRADFPSAPAHIPAGRNMRPLSGASMRQLRVPTAKPQAVITAVVRTVRTQVPTMSGNVGTACH